MEILSNLRDKVKTRHTKQYMLLLFSTGMVSVMQVLISMLLTNNMPVESFAQYRYVINVFLFAQSILSFGLPFTLACMLAREKDDEKARALFGACTIYVLLNALIGGALLAVFYFILKIYIAGMDFMLLVSAPFLFIPAYQYMIEYACSGSNRMATLSAQRLLPTVIMLASYGLLVLLKIPISTFYALVIYIAASILLLIRAFVIFRPSFKDLKINLIELRKNNKVYGFATYIGGLFGVASVNIVSVGIAFFVSKYDYGLYALAFTISAPLSMVISTLGTVLFKESVGLACFPKGTVRYSALACVGMAIAYVIIVEFLTVPLFGKPYKASIPYAQFMGVSSLFVGLGDLFNRFLGANGKTRQLRNGAIMTGIASIATAALVIPLNGLWGAVASRIAANIVYVVAMIAYYRQFKKANIQNCTIKEVR